MNSRHPLLIAFLTAFGVVGAVLLALLIALQCAPFGQNSLALGDANIQYIYYLQYLRNGLLGHDSIAYTFTNQLGSSGVGIYAYYLLDPTNLFVAFVDPADIYAFYDLVSVLRVALAAGFCAIFLSWRFGRPLILTLALSAAYALSQASLLTMDNFMWLDGILMLPLLLMATSYLVRRGRGWVFAATLAVTIVLNWYTGFIDLIVSIPWLIYELLDRERVPGESSAPRLMVAYGVAVILGILVSACVLVPTVLQMRNTPAAGALGGGLLYPPLIRGRSFAPSLLGSFVFGGLYGGNPGTLELWVGPLVMLGCVGALFLARGRRAAHWFLAICAFAPIIIGPLDKILGLLKDVWSSWPRYGYGVVLLLILLAATWLYGWARSLGDRDDGVPIPTRMQASQPPVMAHDPQSSWRSVLVLVPLVLALCGIFLLGRDGNPTLGFWSRAVAIGSLLACCGLVVGASLARSRGRRGLASAACGLLAVLDAVAEPGLVPISAPIEDGSTRGFQIQQCLSPDVVPVPLDEDRVGHLTVRADDRRQCEGWEFALLDLDRLEAVIMALRARGARTLEFANGSVASEVTVGAGDGEVQVGAGGVQVGAGDEALYTSIPYDQGWTVRRNGVVVEPRLFANCLMVVPLEPGANTVEMT